MTINQQYVQQEQLEINLALLEGPIPFLQKYTYQAAEIGLKLLQNVLRTQLEQWITADHLPDRQTIKQWLVSVETNEGNQYPSYQPFNSQHLTGAAYTIAWIGLENVIDSVDLTKGFLQGQVDFLDGKTAWISTIKVRHLDGTDLLEKLRFELEKLLRDIVNTGQLPLQSTICDWAIANKTKDNTSYLARMYWNDAINNLTFDAVDLDSQKYVSIADTSDLNEPFIFFADSGVNWKVVHPAENGVAQVKILPDSYSFYFSWNYQGKEYKTEPMLINFQAEQQAYMLSVQDTGLQFFATDWPDDPPKTPSGKGYLIIFKVAANLQDNYSSMLPVYYHLMADGADIDVSEAIPTMNFQPGVGSSMLIDRSSIPNISVTIPGKTKDRPIKPGQTALLVNPKAQDYTIIINDSLYNNVCPHGIFAISAEPAINFLNQSDNSNLKVAILAKPDDLGITFWSESSEPLPWMVIQDWSQGIVTVPTDNAYMLSIDYDYASGTFINSTQQYPLVDAQGNIALPPFSLQEYGFLITPSSQNGKLSLMIEVDRNRVTKSGEKSEGICLKIWLNGQVLIRWGLPSGFTRIINLPFQYDLLAAILEELDDSGRIVTFWTHPVLIQAGQIAVLTGTKGKGYQLNRKTA